VTAQLIDAIKGHHLWAERYERELKEIFALQDEITTKILSELNVKLTEGEQARIYGKVTDNLEAYLKTVQATWYHNRMDKEGAVLSRQLAEKAIALDPEYAMPYIILARYHVLDVFFGWTKSRKKSLDQAAELAQKAISLDESNPHCYRLLSTIYMFTRQHEKAITEAERALSLAPNSSSANSTLGVSLHMAGRHQEAIAPLEKSIRINPFAPSGYLRRLGAAYRDTGRFEEAITILKKAIKLNPDSLYPRIALTGTYSLAGRDEEARAEASEVLRIQPEISLERLAKRIAYKNKADIDRAIGALRKAGIPEKPPLPLPEKPSIAVLAFENMSGDPEQEYFSDGLSEEIITALSKTPKLFVIARNSSFTYKGKPVKVQQVGRELGVKYVLEGSVRKSSDRIRITAQLVDAKTGNHLWADRYDRDLKDIFSVQDEITKKIITELRVKLTEGEQARIYAKGTDNLEAYLKLMQVYSLIAGKPENNAQARKLAEEAVALDPNWPQAYVFLGITHTFEVFYGMSKNRDKSLEQAYELHQKALALDERLGAAHRALSVVYTLKKQFEKSIEHGKLAVELEPNNAHYQANLARLLMNAGRSEESIPLYENALRLDPYARGNNYYNYGFALWMMGRYKKAIEAGKEARNRSPNDIFSHMLLALTYIELGRVEDSQTSAAEVLRIKPNCTLEWLAKMVPWKNKNDLNRMIENLRKAGLPEK
jgi:TolB-like protein/Flp pilus assembly protein TadD